MNSEKRINRGTVRHGDLYSVRMAFKLPYIYDYIPKLCRQQADVIQNYENANVRNIGQGEPRDRKYKDLILAAAKRTTVQVTRLLL
jgi:hypothetical protein